MAQEVIIREKDCGTEKGIAVREMTGGDHVIELRKPHQRPLPVADVVDPETGEVLFDKYHLFTEEDAEILAAKGIHSLKYARSSAAGPEAGCAPGVTV